MSEDSGRVQIPLWVMGLMGVFVVGAIIVGIELSRNKGRLDFDNSEAGKAKRIVRQYLDENLHDPNYQEVAWGPLKPHYGGQLISLKYRAKNAHGAWVLSTEVFFLVGKKVEVLEGKELEKSGYFAD